MYMYVGMEPRTETKEERKILESISLHHTLFIFNGSSGIIFIFQAMHTYIN
jgi:hypothetical protein